MTRVLRLPWRIAVSCLWLSTVLALVTRGPAQEIHFDTAPGTPSVRAQRVSLDSDHFTVAAGRPDWIELRFDVQPGFHINSHSPHDETLIATELRLTRSGEVQVLEDIYPPGEPLHLNTGAGETLSTYAGEFRVRVEVLAKKGATALSGVLHYQACDAASCYPPRDLPLSVALSAR